jgi:hypothetical protein
MSTNDEDTSFLLADATSLSSILASEVNPTLDLLPHSPTGSSDADSFYFLSYLESSGRKFTVLFHLIILNKPSPPGPLSLLAISALDEGKPPPTNYFSGEVKDDGLKKTEISTAGLGIRVVGDDRARPLGHLFGTLDKLGLEGRAIDASGRQIELALTLHSRGPIFPYLASSVIPFPGGLNYEYALPRMDTSGTLTLDGETCDVTGTTWCDREWGHVGPLKWTWINIQLNDDISVAIWDQQEYQEDAPRVHVGGQAFATILDRWGNITITTAVIEESDFKPVGERTYPNSWLVTIPGRGEITVKTLQPGQKIDSILPRIEAKCTATGSYEGSAITGAAFAEIGEIPNFKP